MLPDPQFMQLVLEEFFQAGGPVLLVLAALALLLWSLLLERCWFLVRDFPRLLSDCQSATSYGSFLQQKCAASIALQTSLAMIKTLIALCPLLGLLGTVVGMIQLFDVLALRGAANPRLMAAGVAQATLPTMAGMVLAVSGLLFYGRLQRYSQQQRQRLNILSNNWRSRI
ncbi:MotA/TolQ/ExbB proton channel family protein [Aliamphritea ceti]|uniref:MotA/TolQ/ExbB proton channel family protein n=1 Tax=Aliamphritea ceti TaxID=1524258 RepID=UPI0021C2CD01|nr:MotA/TolQ/ExbB proton channel family protein [Aliamphritea ceti]